MLGREIALLVCVSCASTAHAAELRGRVDLALVIVSELEGREAASKAADPGRAQIIREQLTGSVTEGAARGLLRAAAADPASQRL